MKRSDPVPSEAAESAGRGPFARRSVTEATQAADADTYKFANGFVCDTDSRGHARPKGRSPLEIVVDASEGFIPLWARNTTLRWRFQERSMAVFRDPDAAKQAIKDLMGEALLAWGSASPVKFAQRDDLWDFEIVVREQDNCNVNGCVLASAFFPDAGRHELVIYPKMFELSRQEQVETLVHEIGHAFGLRHFFANISEQAWPSEIFGTHNRFSIMNYGSDSTLTDADKSDLKALYAAARSGKLKAINGTPIKLVKPFHTLNAAAATDGMVQVGQLEVNVED